MPEKILIDQAVNGNLDLSWRVLLLYAFAAVVGAGGGCAMAAVLRAKGIKVDRWIVLSYAAIGAFAAVFFVALITLKGWAPFTVETVIVYGGGACLIIIGILSGVNVTVHFGARKLARDATQVAGIDVEIKP